MGMEVFAWLKLSGEGKDLQRLVLIGKQKEWLISFTVGISLIWCSGRLNFMLSTNFEGLRGKINWTLYWEALLEMANSLLMLLFLLVLLDLYALLTVAVGLWTKVIRNKCSAVKTFCRLFLPIRTKEVIFPIEDWGCPGWVIVWTKNTHFLKILKLFWNKVPQPE